MEKSKIMVYIGGFITFLIIISFLGGIYSNITEQGSQLATRSPKVINESFIAHNSSDGNVWYLSKYPYVAASGYVVNATTFEVIGINNFTIDSGGLIILANGYTQGLKLNNTNLLITYNYTITHNSILNAGFGANGVVYFVFAGVIVIAAVAMLLKKKSR